MKKADSKPPGNCPFWAAESMKCRICNGGLFIPLDNHRDIFCTSFHYTECRQYVLHSENQITLAEKVRKSEENRRKYLRISTSHQITLISIVDGGQTVTYNPSHVNTLDLSQGGMRVLTTRPLAHDSLVQFSFNESFPHALQTVTGQVKWCNKQLDDGNYQAGVSFKGHHIKEAIGQYLQQKQGHV